MKLRRADTLIGRQAEKGIRDGHGGDNRVKVLRSADLLDAPPSISRFRCGLSVGVGEEKVAGRDAFPIGRARDGLLE